MSTLRTFNLQHPESSNNNIQLAEGGGVSVTAGILTATNVSSTNVTTTEVTATNGTFSGNLNVGGVLSYEDVTNVDSTGIGTFRDGLHVTSGSVGIGTDNPIAHLHLNSSGATQILINTTSSSSEPQIILQDTAANDYFAIQKDGRDLRFKPQGSEALRITSAGKVGINTASPRAVLDIEGNAENATLMLHSNDANANLQFSDNTGGARILNYGGDLAFRTGTNAHVFGTGDSEALRITSGGYVGIGEANPGWHLDIKSTSVNAIVRLKSTGSTNGGQLQVNSDDLILRNRDGGNLQLWTNDIERLRITSGGAVQITGVDDQDNLLVKGGTTHFAVHQDDSDGEVSLRAQDGSGSNNSKYMTFFTNPSGSAAAERLRITSSGNVGINTVNFPPNGKNLRIGSFGGTSTDITRLELHTTSSSGTKHFSIGNNGSSLNVYDETAGAERLRLTSGGDLLLGGQNGYTYDDTGASNTILDIWNSGNNKRGILSLSGNTNGGSSIGTIWFNNDNNSGASPGNNMKLSAAIQAQAVTTDGNAGSDAGARLQFFTKPEGGAMVDTMLIDSIGDIYQRNQRVHTVLHTEYRQLSGGVNTDSTGSFVDIKNFGYTPKRAGSLIVCHFQVQTWNGSSTNMNGDIYFRARFDQGTGTYVNVTYGGNNNRVTGNFDQDSNRQHLYYTHTFGFIAQNTNQHTINLQASNTSSLSTDFNWFHTTDNSNGCWIFEYDQ